MSPIPLDPELERYIESHATPPEPALAALAEQTRASLELPQMLTGPVEGRFLELLVWAIRPQLVLELGTYSGYSALSMAAALPDGGRIVTCELRADHAEFARSHIERSPHAGKIDLRVGPGLETVAGLPGPFDLVFIDADKQSYVDYYEATLPKLAPRGLIVADNTLWSGAVVDGTDASDSATAIRTFNERVHADERVISVILSVRDGITLVRRR